MADLSKLQASVAAQTTIIQSVKTLLAGLSQQIKDAGTDQVALDAITAQLDSNDDELSKAVTDNTPTPPTPAA